MPNVGVFHLFLVLWIGIAAVIFFVLLRVPAPYGRTARLGWGPLISSQLGWIVMESAAVFTFLFIFLFCYKRLNAVSCAFLFLWELHYLNRAYIFPVRMKSGQRRIAVSVVGMALVFNAVNGWTNGIYLFSMSTPYPEAWFGDIRFITGTLLFLAGLSINALSDDLLRRQRKKQGKDYVVPEGFLFRYISCPNYFGEILEWLGWALLTWSLAGLSFFFWTCANLAPRALTYHRWYKAHFPEYPKQRKALIPFVL
jgi:3-oxo-5-alpha-steroid 4-dehydrogenase 1